MSIGLSSIIYMLSAVCFAKMASSVVYMKLGVRTCITVTFLTTALYCVLVPQCSSVYMIFVLQILPGMATWILFSYLTSEAMKYVPQIIGNKVNPKAYTAWKKPIAVDFDSCGTYFITS